MGSFKTEKIEKSSYLSGMIVSMLSILICLVAMCGSAYAFFTATLTSESNRIEAAEFTANVTVVEDPVVIDAASSSKTVTKTDDVYTLSYTPGVGEAENTTFAFRVKKAGTASTGYCKVTFKVDGKEENSAYTRQLGVNVKEDETTEEVLERIIYVVVPAGIPVQVSFEAQWGTYAGTALIEDNTIDIAQLFDVTPLIQVQPGDVAEETEGIFELGVQVVDKSTETEVIPADGSYALSANGQYEVSLSAADGNTAAKGYAIISIDGKTYYVLIDTEQGTDPLTFAVNTAKDVILSVDSEAGDLPGDISGEQVLAVGASISVEAAEPPAEGEEPPAEGEEPPVEDEEPPVEGEEPPVESEEPPVEGEQSPVEGEQSPVEEEPAAEIEEQSEEGVSLEEPIDDGADEEIVAE